MKNYTNKYLYYSGLVILICFVIYVITSQTSNKGQYYTLIVYNSDLDIGEINQELQDPHHRIKIQSTGTAGIPDSRIEVSHTPLYVLIKTKSENIEFVTDRITKLNDFLNKDRLSNQ